MIESETNCLRVAFRRTAETMEGESFAWLPAARMLSVGRSDPIHHLELYTTKWYSKVQPEHRMCTAETSSRIFKTAWFAKKAKAAGISNAALCKAARELDAGQGDDLGGNVWKKRLDKNTKRGIVVNRVGDLWVFVYLFAKSDRENIDDRELRDFKRLARDFGKARDTEIDRMLALRELMEICNE